MRVLGFFVCCLASVSASAVDQKFETSVRWLSQNISPYGTRPGTVIASPSRDYPNYYYHWVRDAGLVMSTWLDVKNSLTHEPIRQRIQQNLYDYWQLSLHHQEQALPAGQGEVKFYVNGDVYTGPWGRPQNDGPAIRALSFMKWREDLLQNRSELANDRRLYSSELPAVSVIKRDLEYVAHLYFKADPSSAEGGRLLNIWEREGDFDVWEEVKGHHFFNRLFQYYALKKGAEVAKSVNDSAHDFYEKIASHLKSELGWHWDDAMGFIQSTIYRDGGLWYKSNLDSAVIIAVLETEPYWYLGNGEWTVTDPRVLSTVNKLESEFQKIYLINQNLAGGFSPLIGRYPEDTYDGIQTNSRGNPWFLNTFYFAEFYYKLASELSKSGVIQSGSISQNFWSLFGVNDKEVINKDSKRFKEIINRVISKGDGFLSHAQKFMGPFGNMSEQIHRDTGLTGVGSGGAQDLSWSYSSHLRALLARDQIKNLR